MMGALGVNYKILCEQKVSKLYIPFDLALPLLGIYLKEISHIYKIICVQGYLLQDCLKAKNNEKTKSTG